MDKGNGEKGEREGRDGRERGKGERVGREGREGATTVTCNTAYVHTVAFVDVTYGHASCNELCVYSYSILASERHAFTWFMTVPSHRCPLVPQPVPDKHWSFPQRALQQS